jgi:hypothetical protein
MQPSEVVKYHCIFRFNTMVRSVNGTTIRGITLLFASSRWQEYRGGLLSCDRPLTPKGELLRNSSFSRDYKPWVAIQLMPLRFPLKHPLQIHIGR